MRVRRRLKDLLHWRFDEFEKVWVWCRIGNDNGEVLSELQHAGAPAEVGRAVANDGNGFGVARQGYIMVLVEDASSPRHRACGEKDGDMESRV